MSKIFQFTGHNYHALAAMAKFYGEITVSYRLDCPSCCKAFQIRVPTTAGEFVSEKQFKRNLLHLVLEKHACAKESL